MVTEVRDQTNLPPIGVRPWPPAVRASHRVQDHRVQGHRVQGHRVQGECKTFRILHTLTANNGLQVQ